MALIECEECGQLISDKARACPNCGNPVKRLKKNRMIPIKAKHKYKIFLLLSIIVALIICLISLFIANKNRKTILEKIVCSDYKVLKEEMGNNIRITDALFFKRTSKSSKDKVWYQVLIVYKQNNSTKYAGFDDEGRYLGDGNKPRPAIPYAILPVLSPCPPPATPLPATAWLSGLPKRAMRARFPARWPA